MTEKINVNTALAKAFFKANEIRSSPDAIKTFKTLLIAAGLEIAKKAAESAKARNRKTCEPQDFENASVTKTEEEVLGNDEEEAGMEEEDE